MVNTAEAPVLDVNRSRSPVVTCNSAASLTSITISSLLRSRYRPATRCFVTGTTLSWSTGSAPITDTPTGFPPLDANPCPLTAGTARRTDGSRRTTSTTCDQFSMFLRCGACCSIRLELVPADVPNTCCSGTGLALLHLDDDVWNGFD